jgi:hypothetical protein
MGSLERLTRQQYKEKYAIQKLPDLIDCTVLGEIEIPDVPFYRVRLTNKFSLLLPIPENGPRQVKKGNRLSIHADQFRQNMRSVDIISRERMFVERVIVDDTQVIPNNHWEEEATAYINRSRNNSESWKERNRWEQYRKSKEPPPPPRGNPNWLKDLKKAATDGIINGYLD